MKRIAAVAFVLAIPMLGQDGPATLQPNTIVVSAQGRVEAAPDTAVVQFSLSAQDKTARAAYDHTAKAADQVRELLKSAGVDANSAEYGLFQLHPNYDYRGSKRKITSYVVSSSVKLRLKDFSRVGPVLDQISSVDLAENVTLNYTLEKTEEAKKRAVEAAMIKARGEADVVARASGRTLGEAISIQVDTQEQQLVYSPRQGLTLETLNANLRSETTPAPTEEFSPQAVAVTATAIVHFAMK